MKPAARLLLIVTALWPLAVPALEEAEERAERARLDTERRQAEAVYTQREQVCRDRFVVSSCMEDAKRERRQALDRLRQQEAVLDEGQRKKRAAQRLEDIGAKVSAQDAQRREAQSRQQQRETQRSEAAAGAASAASSAAAVSQASAPGAPSSAAAAEAASARAQATRSEAAQRVVENEKRQTEAREHRQAVEKRNAERAAQGKRPARPLPVPGASAPASGAR